MWYGATNPTQYPAMVLQARLTKTVNARVPLARGHGLDRRLRQERKPCSYLRRNPQEVIYTSHFRTRLCSISDRYRLGRQPVTYGAVLAYGGSMYSQATASPGISNKASCAHVIDRVAKTPGSGSVGAMEYGTMRAAIEGFGPALMIRGYSRKGAQPRLPRLRRS